MKISELLRENLSSVKVNDLVRLLDYKKDDVNAFARVTNVSKDGVKVSNMNMPFQGTLSNKFFKFDRIKLHKKVTEKMHNIISAYVKGSDRFTLWQDGHYYYSLTKAVQDKSGKFQTIKTFDDMSLDEVENWLSGAGYKKQELKETAKIKFEILYAKKDVDDDGLTVIVADDRDEAVAIFKDKFKDKFRHIISIRGTTKQPIKESKYLTPGWEIKDKSFTSKGFDPTRIQKYVLKNKDDTKEITVSEFFGDWEYSERYSKFSKRNLKSKELDQLLRREGAPSLEKIHRYIDKLHRAYDEDPMGPPSRYESKDIKDDLLEGPLNYDMFAKRKAAENKERLAKQREQQRKEKAKIAAKYKADDTAERYEKGKLTDAELTKVEMIVNDAIGQTFPDSDPADIIYPKLKRMFGEFNVSKILDVVAKKRFNSKNYYEFLADNWDENMESFADIHPEYKKMKNPWR